MLSRESKQSHARNSKQAIFKTTNFFPKRSDSFVQIVCYWYEAACTSKCAGNVQAGKQEKLKLQAEIHARKNFCQKSKILTARLKYYFSVVWDSFSNIFQTSLSIFKMFVQLHSLSNCKKLLITNVATRQIEVHMKQTVFVH